MLDYITLKNLLKQEYLTVSNKFNGKRKMPDYVFTSILEHTNFLDYEAKISERVYYIINDLTSQHTCKLCKSTLRSIKTEYCSSKCAANHSDTNTKRKNTVLEKYSVTNVSQSKQVIEKIKNTSLQKYGVENPAQSDHAREKIQKSAFETAESRMQKSKTTCLKKYGKDHISKVTSIKQKKASTCQDKYGANNFLNSEIGARHRKKLILANYGVDNASKNPLIIQKIKNTKEQRYSNPSYNNREQANLTMKEQFGTHSSRAHWNDDVVQILESKSKLEDMLAQHTVVSLANTLGVAVTTVWNALNTHQINVENLTTSSYENFVQRILDNAQINYQKNNRSILNGLELDFYLPDYNLAIEVNGIYWHSELAGKDRLYHLSKTEHCEQQGIQLIHIWDYQIDQNPQLIESMILNKIRSAKVKIYARNTQVVTLDSVNCNNFLTNNHLSGTINSSIRYGLEFKSQIVAVMTFGKSRFKQGEIELYRFAVLKNHSVVGAAGKLFKHFLNENSINRVITFADRDISQGSVYETLGFKKIDIVPPSYRYFKNRQVYNRLKFQKHKLKYLLENFSPAQTEWQNMYTHGYNRFWNTGQLKYEYTA